MEIRKMGPAYQPIHHGLLDRIDHIFRIPLLPACYAENMNYASLIFGSVMLTSIVLWFIYGRKHYAGPVKEVIEDLHIM